MLKIWPTSHFHVCCNISKVVEKSQCRKSGIRNVTHWCLFWLHFPSPSRQEMFSGSQSSKQKPELKVEYFFSFPSPCTLLHWKKGSHMEIRLLFSYLLPSGGSKLKRKIVSRCTHLLLLHIACYIHTHQHTLDKGIPAFCHPTFPSSLPI